MSLLEKSQSIELSRRTQPFYAKKQSYSLGSGGQVQIEVDTQREFIDFENSRLVFELYTKNAAANADADLIPWVASACIKNLRVKTLGGQMIGHEIYEYRKWCRMNFELCKTNEAETSHWDALEGAQTKDLGTTADAEATQQYAHKFMSHIFTQKEYYPAHFHQGLIIEFDPPAVADIITYTNGVLAEAKINECKYVADLIQLKPEIENEMVRMMEEQKLFVDYEEVLIQQNTLTTGSNQAYDLVGIDGRVKSIFQWTEASGAATADAIGIFAKNNNSSYRFKLGAQYLNYESIKTTYIAEQQYELLKALDKHADPYFEGNSNNTAAVLAAAKFVIGCKVDKAQSNTDESISSMIDKDRNNIRVELAYSATPSALNSVTAVKLDKRLQVLAGSVVRNIRS